MAPMPMLTPPDYNLYLAICRPQPTESSGRWLLILSPPLGSPALERSCITYQASRMPPPSEPGTWALLKEADRPFSYPDVVTRYRLGSIREMDVWMVDEAARGVDPAIGRQRFVVGVVRALEQVGVLEEGAKEFYGKLVDEK